MTKISYNDAITFQAVFYAELGLSTQFISDKTGLSPSQVSYRTRMAGVLRKHYRNGESVVSKRIIEHSTKAVDGQMRTHLKKAYEQHHQQKLFDDKTFVVAIRRQQEEDKTPKKKGKGKV